MQIDRMAEHLLGRVEAVDHRAEPHHPSVAEMHQMRHAVADAATRGTKHRPQPAEGGRPVAIDQHLLHSAAEEVHDRGLTTPLPAKMNDVDGPDDGPVNLVIEIGLEDLEVALGVSRVEILNETARCRSRRGHERSLPRSTNAGCIENLLPSMSYGLFQGAKVAMRACRALANPLTTTRIWPHGR